MLRERKVGVGYLNTLESVSTREKEQVEESKETFMVFLKYFQSYESQVS